MDVYKHLIAYKLQPTVLTRACYMMDSFYCSSRYSFDNKRPVKLITRWIHNSTVL